MCIDELQTHENSLTGDPTILRELLDADRDVVAMALAEPGRAEHGAGAVIPDYGHVSMVFVHPTCGDGVPAANCRRVFTSVHPKEVGAARHCGPGSNACVRRLYEGQGYRRSGQETSLGSGDPRHETIEIATLGHAISRDHVTPWQCRCYV